MMRERLPEPLRTQAVTHLQEKLPDETKDFIRDLIKSNPDDWPSQIHFGMGMGIRNLLRDRIKDGELPVVMYDNEVTHNWDDWYVGVIEETVNG